MHEDWYRDLVDMGLDVEPYDTLLAELGYDDGLESWIDEGRGWVTNNSAVILVNDDELLDAWVRWNETPVGSDEGDHRDQRVLPAADDPALRSSRGRVNPTPLPCDDWSGSPPRSEPRGWRRRGCCYNRCWHGRASPDR